MSKPYARCVECGRTYTTKVLVGQACGRCGNNMRVLNPDDDVRLSPGYLGALTEVCALALGFAVKLSRRSPVQACAPKAVRAISNRVRSFKGKPIAVNWHELQILGWWATQSLDTKITWTKEKLIGASKRVTLFLWEVEQAFPRKAQREPLSRVTGLERDQVEKFFQEGPGRESDNLEPGQPGRALTQDDILQFPKRSPDDNRPHALDPAIVDYKAKGVSVPRWLTPTPGQPLTFYDRRGGVLKKIEAAPHQDGFGTVESVANEKVHFFKAFGPTEPITPGGWLKSTKEMDWVPPNVPILCCPTCASFFVLGENPIAADGTVEKPVGCPGKEDSKPCDFKGRVRLLGWNLPGGQPGPEAPDGAI